MKPVHHNHTENGGGGQRRSQVFRSTTWILILSCTSVLSFYIGVWTGVRASEKKTTSFDNIQVNIPCPSGKDFEKLVVEQAMMMIHVQRDELCKTISSKTTVDANPSAHQQGTQLFSKSISHFVEGIARVTNVDLMETFDFGVPPNQNINGLDALIVYSDKRAMPTDKGVRSAIRYEDPTKPLPLLSAKSATENCDMMNVVMMDNFDNVRQCVALIGGQYRNYHVQHWLRRKDDIGGLDASMPLKLTSRGLTVPGREDMPAPTTKQAQDHQVRLRTYLNEIDNIKLRLKQTLTNVPSTKAILIMTCNFGQSELLMNFVCSARARGFSLHNLLVFPTDRETRDLADGLGLTTFYEEKLMASIPKQESMNYGGPLFAAFMFAKVLCVQLVNELGYDVLFQDADIVWYKDPLEFFYNETLPKFDLYFQDDGNRQDRFAPYSANTGFYFVRSNDRTRNLFRHFLYTADLITAWYSHQAVLISMMAEHNSAFGLTVKVYSKEMEEFPGGLHFHRQKEMMKKIIGGNSKAYIFHMSWTQNKIDKLKFLKQMGEWFVKEQCIGKEALAITATDGGSLSQCCTMQPVITCYYKDKPSKVPCPDSPMIDRNGVSFW